MSQSECSWAARLAKLTALRHPYSVDLYMAKILSKARFVLVRLLGGMDYWRYGVDELAALARSGFEIPLRVGIHSGEIVVHPLRISGVHTLDAAGEAVHLAARLQQDAPSGSTWISDATFALVRGRVETRIVGPQPFRGFAVPVVVHLLQAADASLSRLDVAGRRGLSPFVDRRAELNVLEAAYARAAAGKGCAVALIGDPGVGKSRLIREFVAARSGVLRLSKDRGDR